MPIETESLDEEARLRVRIKADVGGILETALARARGHSIAPAVIRDRAASGRLCDLESDP
jgi:hypothetical protein